MTDRHTPAHDREDLPDEFASQLEAIDDAVAEGRVAGPLTDPRLAQAQDLLQLIQRIRQHGVTDAEREASSAQGRTDDPAPARFQEALAILREAIQKESTQERSRFLGEACAHDPELPRIVELLLASFDDAGNSVKRAGDGAATITPVTERSGSVIGPYKLLQQIGEGGFGVVYMAEQTRPVRRKVALKIIKPGMDSKEVIARFEAERQALALMDHPNIAKVFNAGATDSGRPYFVMELVRGIPLIEFCDSNNLSTHDRLGLFVAICRAIQHAHQKGIIHRDLKPSNVMVTLHDNRPVPKVIDFGVAKAISQQLTEKTMFTQYGQMVGTPVYMSPEQAQMSGLDVDTRSDIYSLGVLLYELLTGTTPLDADRLRHSGYAEMQRLIREEEAPRPSARLSTQRGEALAKIAKQRSTHPTKLSQFLRGDLDWIVMKALEKERNRRYDTANSLVADIERFLNDEPVEACPPSAGYRFRKFARRNQAALATCTLVAIAIIVGTVGTTWQAIRATNQRNRAMAAEARARGEADRANDLMQRETVSKERAESALKRVDSTLVDMYTMTGIHESERGKDALAALWFANAALNAKDDPARHVSNAIRFETWRRRVPRPIAAWLVPYRDRGLLLMGDVLSHPRLNYVIATVTHTNTPPWATETALWNVDAETEVRWPGDITNATVAAFSRDGAALAVGNDQGQVVMVDFPGGKKVTTVQVQGPVYQLQFSGDGRYLATASGQTARIWDCQTDEFATPELPHPDLVITLAWDPNSEALATGCLDGKCRVFSIGPAAQPRWPGVEHLSSPADMRQADRLVRPFFTEDGRSLITRKNHGRLVWSSTSTGMPDLERTFTAGRIRAVTASPSGRYLAITINRQGEVGVQLVLAESSLPTGPFLKRSNAPISVAFSQDETMLLTGGMENNANLSSVPGGESLIAPLVHAEAVGAVGFGVDATSIFTAQAGGLHRCWQLPADDAVEHVPLDGRESSAASNSEGTLFIPTGLSHGGCQLRSTRVYEVGAARPVGPILRPEGIIVDAAFSPDGKSVATISSSGRSRDKVLNSEGKELIIWDWSSGEQRSQSILETEPRHLAYSPRGDVLAVNCAGGELLILDAATGKELRRWRLHAPRLNAGWWLNNGSVQFSPDGKSILTYGPAEDGLSVWSLDAGERRYPNVEAGAQVVRVEFSPDGKSLATASYSNPGRAQVWDFATGKPLGVALDHPDWVHHSSFSPDGRHLVTACRDHHVRIWEWETGRLISPPLAHEDESHDARFTPDGRFVLSVSADATFRVWDWRTGKPVTPPFAIGGKALSLSVTPDGRKAIVGGFLEKLVVVDLLDLYPDVTFDNQHLSESLLDAELLSGFRVHQGGGTERLTSDQWLDRWKRRHGN